MNDSLLMEVVPSPANIAMPTDEVETWVAVDGGGFERNDGLRDITSPFKRMSTKTIKKKRPKFAGFFVNHCENKACDLPPGHEGLCSHMIVKDKRRSRSK